MNLQHVIIPRPYGVYTLLPRETASIILSIKVN